MKGERMAVIEATNDERDALLSALDHNCACEIGPFNVRLSTCEAHALLLDEQALLRLLFYRRYVGALCRGEWMQEPGWLRAGPWKRTRRASGHACEASGIAEAPPDILSRAA
jgi:hypothetical protein